MNNEETTIKFNLILSQEEKKKCLQHLRQKNKRILNVYENSMLPNSNCDYKEYTKSVLLYTSSSNELFKGELVDIVVNLYSIINNDFNKAQIRKIVLENMNLLDYFIQLLEGKVGE